MGYKNDYEEEIRDMEGNSGSSGFVGALMAGIALIFIGGLMCFGFFYNIIICSSYVDIDGVVVKIKDNREESNTMIVEFNVGDKNYEIETLARKEVGDVVKLRYNPKDPTEYSIYDVDDNSFPILGIILILFGIMAIKNAIFQIKEIYYFFKKTIEN